MNNDLRAIKGVVVDAGHGGDDPGAVNGNVKEIEYDFSNYISVIDEDIKIYKVVIKYEY